MLWNGAHLVQLDGDSLATRKHGSTGCQVGT
jgi:hypothetical protein